MSTFELALPFTMIFIVLLLAVFLGKYGSGLNVLDVPDNDRKFHLEPVPMVGGIAIYGGCAFLALLIDLPDRLFWLFLTSSLILLLGYFDDAYSLGVRVRLAGQVAVTIIMGFGSGLWISQFGVFSIPLDNSLAWLSVIATLVTVVGLTNVFNLADGLDGLASGYFIVSIVSLALTMYFSKGAILHQAWLISLLSGVFGFWLINMSYTPFKKIFLGDAGSLFLGFTLAWLLIYYSQHENRWLNPVATLWCVALPCFDTIAVVFLRLLTGRPITAGSRDHLHHLVMRLGWKPGLTSIAILLIAGFMSGSGVIVTYTLGFGWGLFGFLFCLSLYCGAFVGLSKRYFGRH